MAVPEACRVRELHDVVGVGLPVFWLKVSELVTMWMGFLQFVGRRLVGLGGPFGIALQVDVHFADGLDVAALPGRR